MWQVLLVLVAGSVAMTDSGSDSQPKDKNCVRYLDSHFFVNLSRNFHHINFKAALARKLRDENTINDFTFAIIMERVRQSTHRFCEVEARHKRQAVAGGVLLFPGGALITPLLEHFLHPQSATHENLVKINSFLSDLAYHVNDLEVRVRYIERQSEILELLLGIVTSLEVEQEKYAEITSRDEYSSSLRKLLEPVKRRYEDSKILKKRKLIDLKEERIPHATWKLSARMLADPNCTKAALQAAVYASIPSKSCLEVSETAPNFVMLQRGEKCLILPTLASMTLLPDGSVFSQSNYFITEVCDVSRLNDAFTFQLKLGVFLALPKMNGSAIGDCGEVSRKKIYAKEGAAVHIGCSGYLASGSESPKVSDLYAPRIRAWTLNETELQMMKQDSFLYIDKSVGTINKSSEPEKIILPVIEEGYEYSITPGWYGFGFVFTVCFCSGCLGCGACTTGFPSSNNLRRLVRKSW